jgi:hypothetical protein
MKKIALIAVLSFCATPLVAMPITSPQQSSDEMITLVRKGGGSSRSAKTGRFVSRGYARSHRSTTVTHRKY